MLTESVMFRLLPLIKLLFCRNLLVYSCGTGHLFILGGGMQLMCMAFFLLLFVSLSAQRLTVTSCDMIGQYFMLAVRTRATRVLTFAHWAPLP